MYKKRGALDAAGATTQTTSNFCLLFVLVFVSPEVNAASYLERIQQGAGGLLLMQCKYIQLLYHTIHVPTYSYLYHSMHNMQRDHLQAIPKYFNFSLK